MNTDFLLYHPHFEDKTTYQGGYYINESFQFDKVVEHGFRQTSSAKLKIEYSLEKKKVYWGGKYKGIYSRFWGDNYQKLEETPFWFPPLVLELKNELEKVYETEFEINMHESPSFFTRIGSDSIGGIFQERQNKRLQRSELTRRKMNMIHQSLFDTNVKKQLRFEEVQEKMEYMRNLVQLTPYHWENRILSELNDLRKMNLDQLVHCVKNLYQTIKQIDEKHFFNHESMAIIYEIFVGSDSLQLEGMKKKFQFDVKFVNDLGDIRRKLHELMESGDTSMNYDNTLSFEYEKKKEFLENEHHPLSEKIYLVTDMNQNGELSFKEMQDYFKRFGLYSVDWDLEKRRVIEKLSQK